MITEMDRFTDEELTAVYNDPGMGGVLRTVLAPILMKKNQSDAVKVVKGRALLAASLEDPDPLFLDDLFIDAFLRNWRDWVQLLTRFFADGSHTPKRFKLLPAFSLKVFDRLTQKYVSKPTAEWLRAANKAGWLGVIHPEVVSEDGGMVARIDSAIWDYLFFRDESPDRHIPFLFDRSGRYRRLLMGVGLHDLARYYKSMGVHEAALDVGDWAKNLKDIKRRSYAFHA